ncbi:hypothetical protein EV426DRAFT_606784 [Tirmania nivea]|nr:hypothetical protein EV426DRAFT_606784 [Tirmania nivea]
MFVPPRNDEFRPIIKETLDFLAKSPSDFHEILLERLVSKVTEPLITQFTNRCAQLELDLVNKRAQSAQLELDLANQRAQRAQLELDLANQRAQLELGCERKLQTMKFDLHNRHAASVNEHQTRIMELNAKVALYAKNFSDFKMLRTVAEAIDDQLQPGHYYQASANRTTRHIGSVTRAKAWARAIDDPNTTVDAETPAGARLVLPSSPRSELEIRVSEGMMRLACAEEIQIDYPLVVSLLTDYFAAQPNCGNTYVIDTHRQRFLDDRAPDIVIQRHTSSPDKFNVAAVIDLKAFGNTANHKLGTYDNFGQILDYLTLLSGAQEGRSVFLGLLTNLRDAYLLKFSTGILKGRSRRTSIRGAHTSKLVQYRKVPLHVALKHLYMELTSPEANPPNPCFSEAAGTLVRVLQRHKKSVVAVFRREETRVVVKTALESLWIPGIVNEISLLHSLQGPNKPTSIPTLIYDTLPPDANVNVPITAEFGIKPVGRPIYLELFPDSASFLRCLEDILTALQWVHDHGIVHRDVRGDNIIIYQQDHPATVTTSPEPDPMEKSKPYNPKKWRGVLIDFDRATTIGKECLYEGGYICCPVELLRVCTQVSSSDEEMADASSGSTDVAPGYTTDTSAESFDNITALDVSVEVQDVDSSPLSHVLYAPQKSHDYLAFVLLVNTLIFPFTLQGYSYNRVEMANSKEQKRLLRLWDALKVNEPWKKMVAAAEDTETDLGEWRKMLGMLQWL